MKMAESNKARIAQLEETFNAGGVTDGSGNVLATFTGLRSRASSQLASNPTSMDTETIEANQSSDLASSRTNELSKRNKSLAGDASMDKVSAPTVKSISTPAFDNPASPTSTTPTTQPTVNPNVTDYSGTQSYGRRKALMTR